MTSKFLVRNEDGEFQLCNEKSSGPKYQAVNQFPPFYLPTPKLSTHIPSYLPTYPSTHPPSHCQSSVINSALSNDGVISTIHLRLIKCEYFWYTHALYTIEMDLTLILFNDESCIIKYCVFCTVHCGTIMENKPKKCTLFILMI